MLVNLHSALASGHDASVAVHVAPGLPGLDLPIAVGVLAASGQLESAPSAVLVGTLGLDGSVAPPSAHLPRKDPA